VSLNDLAEHSMTRSVARGLSATAKLLVTQLMVIGLSFDSIWDLTNIWRPVPPAPPY